MGIYTRRDSKSWWMWLEGTGVRRSTGILVDAGTAEQRKEQRRQAELAYAKAVTAAATAPATAPKDAITYTAHAQWYETHHAAHLRGATRVRSILAQLAPHFAHVTDLRQLTAADIREWMTARKRTVAPATVNRELDVLKSLLAHAVPRYLEASPASEVRRFRVPEQDMRVLTVEEEQRLLEVASAADAAWLMLAIDTLLRLGNTVRLRWGQVRLAQQLVVPLNAKVSVDSVPLSQRVCAALQALPTGEPTDYVFPQFHSGTGASAAENAATRTFQRLCALARVDYGRVTGGVTIHSLRHTGATRALKRGASVRTVMRLGGWRNERMVMRYTHATDADLRQAVESIGAGEPDAS